MHMGYQAKLNNKKTNNRPKMINFDFETCNKSHSSDFRCHYRTSVSAINKNIVSISVWRAPRGDDKA